MPPARLVPEIPLPSYTFVPGRNIHPHHPQGHSYGQLALRERLDPARWWECRTYLLGIDLFNGPAPGLYLGTTGFYWESHVEWEALWLACDRRGVVADFLKALIQLAAAGVKHLEGRPVGVSAHAARAAELWRDVMHAVGQERFLGLRLQDLIDSAESIGRHGWPDEPPTLVPVPGSPEGCQRLAGG